MNNRLLFEEDTFNEKVSFVTLGACGKTQFPSTKGHLNRSLEHARHGSIFPVAETTFLLRI